MAQPHEIDQKTRDAYWKETMRITWIILVLWFVSWVGPLVLHGTLNKIVIFGFPMGYYMGAQGSLIIFVILIFWYAFKMNKADAEYGVEEEE